MKHTGDTFIGGSCKSSITLIPQEPNDLGIVIIIHIYFCYDIIVRRFG